MSGQENVAVRAPGSSKDSGAHGPKDFSEAYTEFWQLPIHFSAAAAHDPRLNPSIRGLIVHNLGMVAGISETLVEAYTFASAGEVFDRPENVERYTAIMSNLLALFKAYKSGKRLNAIDLENAIADTVSDLLDFLRKVMGQLRAGGC